MLTYAIVRPTISLIGISLWLILLTINAYGSNGHLNNSIPVDGRTGCQTIDFNTDGNGDSIFFGQVIDSTTYSALGLYIYAGYGTNASGDTTSNPIDNPAVIFDSANPSGGDVDLGTPSRACLDCAPMCDSVDYPGISNNTGGLTNCTPLGNIIIIEETFVDVLDNDTGLPVPGGGVNGNGGDLSLIHI